jgi:transglutaminase-like putative cysteine protease
MSDNVWLVQAWLAMAVVLVPAALLRRRRSPSALDIWPGIILLVPVLTRLYVPHHAWAGIIPTGRTISDVGTLMDSLHRTTSDEMAPIHSTIAVRLVMSALLGLLAALIDLIAVVGRRGALAGVPLLVIYTVSGAVPRSPVGWGWFAVAAVGYLILLGLDADDELRTWGRRISRDDQAEHRPGLGFSAQRIGVLAIVVAVLVPLLVPDHPKNLIADAFHDSSSNGLGGFGAGSGSGGISPFAELKGELKRQKAVAVMTVHVDALEAVQPYNLRSNVLDRYTDSGWSASNHGATEPLGSTAYDTFPPSSEPATSSYSAAITITGLTSNAPIFSVPRDVQGLASDTTWNSRDQLLLGSTVHEGEHFTEDVTQPQPSVEELKAAPPVSESAMARWLDLPKVPDSVGTLVAQITTGQQTPYGKARALSNWFADPANGFTYSLKTKAGDSGNDLVDFLQQRSGYCQQYAAAMAVMLRLAHVPSRVVLGYMHPAPDAHGNFKVTSFDAHAWVEAYFGGLGWIPFDPTPTTGLAGGKKTDLPWAPHVYSTNSNDVPTRTNTAPAPQRNSASASTTHAAPVAAPSSGGPDMALIWTALSVLLLLLLGLTPGVTRATRRRRRLLAARGGDPDALWAELSDTATDLGYVWSPARSPRQVSAWLSGDAASAAPALDALAVAVERRRYAPGISGDDAATLTRGLQAVTGELRSRRDGRARLRAALWPASLGWGLRFSRVTALIRRRH